MVEVQDLINHEVKIPLLLDLESAISFYVTEVYVYCGHNLKQTSLILDISESQLVSLIDSELDFS